MKFAGEELLSRSTVAAGRSLLAVSTTVILVDQLGVDTSTFELLGVRATPKQLTLGTSWILLVLWVSLLVNWISDLSSLGRWNSAMSDRRVETVMDGGGKIRGRLEFLIEQMEREIQGSNSEESKLNEESWRFFEKNLRELNSSYWLFNKVAAGYVVGWGFIVPTMTALVAWALLQIGWQ